VYPKVGQNLGEMNRRGFALCFLALLTTSTAEANQQPWNEVRSQHFRVLTNGSPGQARKVAREFEQLRWVFSSRFPGARLDTGAPLLIFATTDENTAKVLEPAGWKLMQGNLAGFFRHSWEKQFALIRLDTFGGNGSKEVVYHEYAHTIEHLNARWTPSWLDEGIAEFYAYTRFEEHKIYLGAPTIRVRVLRGRMPDPIEKIISVTQRNSTYATEFFYAESWALVHFLIYGPGMENGKKLDQFFTLLQQQRVDQKAVFQQVFGDFGKLNKELASYMLQPTFATTILNNAPVIDEKSFSSRPLSVAETEAELGGYHLWIHDLETARSLTEQALRDDPKLGLAHENMAFLRFQDGNTADASKEFAEAARLDDKLFLSLFYGAMLSPQATSNRIDDMNAFGASLGKVLQANPNFAAAYVQLARLAVREGDLDSALAVARKAEELEPTRAGYHLLTGQILQRMGKGQDAASLAEFVADRWFGPDHDEAVELWNKIPDRQRPAGVSIVEIVPADTESVEGTVKNVVCGKDEWELNLNHDGKTLTFRRKGGFVSGYSDTLWFGGDHFSLCHHVEGLRAIIRYRAPSDASYAGDAAEIEIRDDLPEAVKVTAASLPQ